MSKSKISKNISYKEATNSQEAIRRGIDNIPNQDQLANMKIVAEKIFQPVREHFKLPIMVSSFFRSPELNKAIGGSTTSDHCKGRAIDMDADIHDDEVLTNTEIFHFIKDNLEFDQLIWEYGDDNEPNWVHASYRTADTNRKQILRATSKGYVSWEG